MAYNIATGLMFVCPITNQVKGSPFEVAVPAAAPVTGAILANQMRAVDWLARNAEYHSLAPPQIVDEVLARIEAILGL
jgi:mRNA interferase MazF